jgi:hypothetical protein
VESREALRSRLPLSDSNSNGTPYRRIAVYLRNLAASRLPKRFKRASTYDEVQDRCRDVAPLITFAGLFWPDSTRGIFLWSAR